jgi:hypothetical protein
LPSESNTVTVVEKFEPCAGFAGSQAAAGGVAFASRFAVTSICAVGLGESAAVLI